MYRRILVALAAFYVCMFFVTPTAMQAQSGNGVKRMEQLSQQLNLTPQQKMQLAPILAAEAPKIQAIKADTSLSRMQKIEKLRAVHQTTDPQVKAILTPDQYQTLQGIRRQEIRQVMRKKMNQ